MKAFRVLVADDATFLRDMLKTYIRDKFPNVEIMEAHDGMKAQQLLTHQHFDLVLSDWEMPEISGEALLTWLRQQPLAAQPGFMMVTVKDDKSDVLKVLQLGADDYLTKPFSRDQFMQKFTRLMIKRGLLTPREARQPGPIGKIERPSESLDTLKRVLAAPVASPAPQTEQATPARIKPGKAHLDWSNAQHLVLIKSCHGEHLYLWLKRQDDLPPLGQVLSLEQEGQRFEGLLLAMQLQPETADAPYIQLRLRLQSP